MSASAASSVTASSGFDTSRLPIRTLGQDDFLKLVVAQLTSQDPLNPMKDTEFIAQMAQFSQLEQAKSMQTDIAALREDQSFLQASAMLGRSVELSDARGVLTRGTVSAIQLGDGTPMIVVNGQPRSLDEVVSISPATADPVTPAAVPPNTTNPTTPVTTNP
jgi:flagellar basal-body rod modification protein FlgD